MNTFEHIPFDSVAPIMLESAAHPGWPFFSGTGFFVYFPPYVDIFFITAKHCVRGAENEELGDVKIKYHPNQTSNEAVLFEEYMLTEGPDGDGLEDLAIYVVGDVTKEKRDILKKRALPLQHQDDVDFLIKELARDRQKVRTVGFPSVSKEIRYEEGVALVRPRGFHGNLEGDSGMKNRYKVEGLSWKEGELEGFSGSPIISLCLNVKGEIQAIPIGVLLTGSAHCAHFLSINVATNSVASYLIKKYHSLTASTTDETDKQ